MLIFPLSLAKVDCRDFENPYEKKWGDNWRDVVVNTAFMRNYVDVQDYVTHVFEESRNVFKGTTHEHDWMVYHDALSLMTADDTLDWMESKGYLQRWIRPEKGINCETAKMKRWYSRVPPGNSPEMNILDNQLNKDIHNCMEWHCVVTRRYPKGDPKKFSMATPKLGQKAHERLLDPGEKGVVPTSARIIQDTQRCIDCLFLIREAKGCVIKEYRKQQGHRRPEADPSIRRGGKRQRKQEKDDYRQYDKLHEDAKKGVADAVIDSVKIFKGEGNENNGDGGGETAVVEGGDAAAAAAQD